jgi:outer membrane receptor protein involved in Fe transport
MFLYRVVILFFFLGSAFVWGQKESAFSNSLQGQVVDKTSGEVLEGVTVFIVGTYKGGFSDESGKYRISDIKPGEYSVRFSLVGYTEQLINGVKITADGTITLNAKMTSTEKSVETIEIVGQKNLLDLESGRSEIKLSAEELKDINANDVQSIASMQVGVNKTPDGLQIRGARVYETQYLIDGVNAQDPLAGTGFGVELSKNAIQDFQIVSGGAGAEYSGGTGGVVMAKTRDGGDKFNVSGSWQRDNFGTNTRKGWSWNTDIVNISVGGPLIPKFKKNNPRTGLASKLFFFASGSVQLTDNFYRIYADQLRSSLMVPAADDPLFGLVQAIGGSDLTKDAFFAPRQDNKWSGTFKLTYKIRSNTRISISSQQSLNINQNTRSLMIVGNDVIMTPGFQESFSLQPDNGNTYTHRSNLSIINFHTTFAKRWSFETSVGRLFTNLRADANGRPFRTATVDRIFDPASIVTNPITIFNPGDSVILVNPGPPYYNNDGIATLWHDHYAQELTFKTKFTLTPDNKIHFYTFGIEHKEQEYQWIDVTAPWIGAPVTIISGTDTTRYASNRIGYSNDIWKVKPAQGMLFFQDQLRYKGIIASLGLQFSYWAYGKFADQAVADPNAPVLDIIRKEYMDQTVALMGRRWKARLLPKINISFPVTENNVLYFNYSHALRLAHPRMIYAGLDPFYQNRSVLANLGNPNLNPETTVSYEVGLKSQITSNLALSITAFYNDKFDFVVNRSVTIRDRSGFFTQKSFNINQDYARIRGIEVSLNNRIGKWFRGTLSFAYQAATGKSNSARESLLQIQQTGRNDPTREQYLAWDRPLDIKGIGIFKSDSNFKPLGIPLKNFTLMISATWKSGLRYTPYTLSTRAEELTGRPIYVIQDDKPFSKIGSAWSWVDIRLTRDFAIRRSRKFVSLFFEVKNIFNTRNAAIVNPLTGSAYRPGDPLLDGFRDSRYPNPGLDRFRNDPNNPARFTEPRQMFIGLNFGF